MRSIKSVEQRFFEKVDKSGPCWSWKGVKDHKGYGRIHMIVDGVRKNYRAHRLSHEIHHGEIPSGMDIMHSCDNPSCVNPEHLSAGTRSENMLDAALKGRITTVGKSKVTHCQLGHEYTEENTYRSRLGHRRCKACVKIENVRNRAKAKAAILKGDT